MELSGKVVNPVRADGAPSSTAAGKKCSDPG